MEKFNGKHEGSNGLIESTQITTYEGWNSDKIQLIKNTVCRESTNDELKLFLYTASRANLDPLARQIYAVKRWDSKLGKAVMQIQISIDGFRVIAERSKCYEGQLGPFWCGKDGKWVDVWTQDELPFAARVGVLKTGFREPLWAVARFDAYAQTYTDKKTNKTSLSMMWAKMPDLMIAKVAEMLALRRAFPMDLSGIYGQEEIPEQIDTKTKIIEPDTTEKKPTLNDRFLKKEPDSKKISEFGKFLIPIGINTGKTIEEVPEEKLTKLLLGLRGLKSLTDDQQKTKEAIENFLKETTPSSTV